MSDFAKMGTDYWLPHKRRSTPRSYPKTIFFWRSFVGSTPLTLRVQIRACRQPSDNRTMSVWAAWPKIGFEPYETGGVRSIYACRQVQLDPHTGSSTT